MGLETEERQSPGPFSFLTFATSVGYAMISDRLSRMLEIKALARTISYIMLLYNYKYINYALSVPSNHSWRTDSSVISQPDSQA